MDRSSTISSDCGDAVQTEENILDLSACVREEIQRQLKEKINMDRLGLTSSQELIEIRKYCLEIRELFYQANNLENLTLSIPIDLASIRIAHRQLQNQVENLLRLGLACEKRPHREKCSHETAYPRTPETSRCTACDSSTDTSTRARSASHQTNIVIESCGPLLCQLLILASELREMIIPSVSPSPSESFLKLTPELECHVERREDHIHIRFLCDSHPKFWNSELVLHLNSHSS